MPQNQDIRTISLEELLTLEGLQHKESKLGNINVDRYNGEQRQEMVYRAYRGNEILAGSHELSSRGGKIELDSDGVPYLRKTLGPITCEIYDPIFIANGKGEDLSEGLTAKMIRTDIFKMMEKENHPVYQQFLEEMRQLNDKIPLIQDAKNRAKFLGDSSGLQKFSDAELEIYERVVELYAKNSQAIHGKNPLAAELDPNFKKSDSLGFVYLHIAFDYWYRHHLISKGYEKRIEDPFQRWVNHVMENLEARGFRRVEQFSYRPS